MNCIYQQNYHMISCIIIQLVVNFKILHWTMLFNLGLYEKVFQIKVSTRWDFLEELLVFFLDWEASALWACWGVERQVSFPLPSFLEIIYQQGQKTADTKDFSPKASWRPSVNSFSAWEGMMDSHKMSRVLETLDLGQATVVEWTVNEQHGLWVGPWLNPWGGTSGGIGLSCVYYCHLLP